MRTGWWWLAATMALPAGAEGQSTRGSGAVRGVVIDAGGVPVTRARIEAVRSQQKTETDPAGSFALRVELPDTLIIRAIGFRGRRLPADSDGSSIRVVLTAIPLQLNEIVVTVSRRPQRAGESAIPVTTVGAEEISAAAAVSADRMLAQIPGLQILPSNPTGADLSIRGISGGRVLVLQDGEPAAGALLENRDLSRLSTIGVDRLEVVKGPLSALYGSDALGGVVNLVTRDPAGPLCLSAEARAGDTGRRDARVSAESGTGPVAARFDGGWREDRRVASIATAEHALARVWDFKASARVRPTATLRLRADGALLRERQRWQISSDGFNGFNDNQGASGWVEAELARGGPGSFRARVYAEEYQHRFRQAQGLLPLAGDTAPAQRERMVKGRLAWGGGFGGHSLDAGIDLLDRRIEAPGKVDGAVSDQGLEGYAQDNWATGRLLMTPAARLSWNSRWGTSLTPSLAVAWEVAPALRLRTGVARGFRGPSFKELLWDFPNPTAGYAIHGNPALAPERSWQLSLGGAWSPVQGLVADAEVYRNALRDLIELTATGNDPSTGLLIFTPRNVSRARTEGVDLSLRWSAATWYSAVEYSHLAARDLEIGTPLDRRAAESARFRVGGRLSGLSGLRADVTAALTGSAPLTRPDGSPGRQEAFLSGNVQLQYELPGGVGLSAGADNLFDARPTGWTGVTGRRVYLGLSGTWRP